MGNRPCKFCAKPLSNKDVLAWARDGMPAACLHCENCRDKALAYVRAGQKGRSPCV